MLIKFNKIDYEDLINLDFKLISVAVDIEYRPILEFVYSCVIDGIDYILTVTRDPECLYVFPSYVKDDCSLSLDNSSLPYHFNIILDKSAQTIGIDNKVSIIKDGLILDTKENSAPLAKLLKKIKAFSLDNKFCFDVFLDNLNADVCAKIADFSRSFDLCGSLLCIDSKSIVANFKHILRPCAEMAYKKASCFYDLFNRYLGMGTADRIIEVVMYDCLNYYYDLVANDLKNCKSYKLMLAKHKYGWIPSEHVGGIISRYTHLYNRDMYGLDETDNDDYAHDYEDNYEHEDNYDYGYDRGYEDDYDYY
jgi:hypothetical protein